MDISQTKEIENSLENMKDIIDETIKTNQGFPIVIIIGKTGSGKSSIARCMTKNDVVIKEEKGRKIVLKGIGIQSGFQSYTKCPSILIDYNTRTIYCDCPGFDDTDGYIQEIINSFIINYLLEISTNKKYKILLVISESEFNCGRGQPVSETFDRLSKMFPNRKDLEKGLGLIITKGENDIDGNDYLELLDSFDIRSNVYHWAQFFKSNLNQVFTFPKALRSNLDQIYDFNDRSKLNTFIQNYQYVNPYHEIALSDTGILFLRNVQSNVHANIKENIRNAFILLIDKYKNETNSSKLNDMINLLNRFKNNNIQSINEFNDFILHHLLNTYEYQDILTNLEKNDIIGSFTEKIIKGGNSSLINNETTKHCNSSIYELQAFSKAIEKEKNLREFEERQRKIREEEERLQKQIEENNKKQEEAIRKEAELRRQILIKKKTCRTGKPHVFWGRDTCCSICNKPKCQCGYTHSFNKRGRCIFCHEHQCSILH